MLKIKSKLFYNCMFIILLMYCMWIFSLSVSAHRLDNWSQTYTVANANSTYSFAFNNSAHINGKIVKYCWENNTAKSYFSSYLINGFTVGWKGLLAGVETTSSEAHVILRYDPIAQPTDKLAEVVLNSYDENQHIRPGYEDSEMIIYREAVDKNPTTKLQIMTHEIGHLWGITDLYNNTTTLESIYSKPYNYNHATRHDLNALRIGLNNLWFDPGTGGVWSYQESPGLWRLRADVDYNNVITAADSRLVLQYSANLVSFNAVQRRLADVDESGDVTAADARLILQYSSQQITQFPADE